MFHLETERREEGGEEGGGVGEGRGQRMEEEGWARGEGPPRDVPKKAG